MDGFYNTLANNGTLTWPALNGGVARLSTIAQASGQSNLFQGQGTSTNVFSLVGTATPVMYIAARMAITTAIDNVTQCTAGVISTDGSSFMRFGVNGAKDTAKYTAISSAGTATANKITSTVNIDTGYHTFELWTDGTAAHTAFAVDGETPVAANGTFFASATLGQVQSIQCANGATATARVFEIDKILYVLPGQ